jgi:acylphosphatase
MESLRTVSITVSGKVQGVFYRQSTKEKANQLNLTGEVRNLENGDVLIIATGPEEKLIELTGWCKQGPKKAQVRSIEVKDIPLHIFEKFSILR